jgi:hypothetical protein
LTLVVSMRGAVSSVVNRQYSTVVCGRACHASDTGPFGTIRTTDEYGCEGAVQAAPGDVHAAKTLHQLRGQLN